MEPFLMRNTHTCVCMHTLEIIYFQCLQISLYREGDGYDEEDDDDDCASCQGNYFSSVLIILR